MGDWHYNKGIKYKSAKTVIDLLVDIVSRNGKLLLNFPLNSAGKLDSDEEVTLDGDGPGTADSAKGGAGFNENKRKELSAEDV